MHRLLHPIAVALLLLLPATSAHAGDTWIAGVFGDNMVLQRERPVPVWGAAPSGSEWTVTFAGQTHTTTGTNERWSVTLDPLPANNNGADLTIAVITPTGETNTKTFTNVVVGEVWHASGQSNMGWAMRHTAKKIPQAAADLAAADLPGIRFRNIATKDTPKPSETLAPASWTVSTPASARAFSAVSFYFARQLHRELGVPLGIIDTARGGTPIEPFIPRPAFTGHPVLEREGELGDTDDLDGIWKLPGGVRARSPLWLPGRLYNSRIHPFRHFALRGAIWYQGESNSGKGEDPRAYAAKQRALFKGWRTAFNQPDMPCYFVQLPGSGAWKNWPYLREQQRLAMDQAHTGMAVTIDLLDDNIHPPNKLDVGDRLARWALAKTYGTSDLPFSGPLFREAKSTGPGTLTVHFDHADGLMLARKVGIDPPVPDPALPLRPLELADASGKWHPAQSKIDGDTLIVRNPLVPTPVAVRYGYAPSPKNCHLYNRHGLPAVPFCSKPDLLVASPDIPAE